jgi:Flp pilus assembly protein TadG
MKSYTSGKKPLERGQGFVELLLVLPVLLLIIAAMVEVGWWLHDYVTVTRASREAARFGSRNIHVDPTDIATVAAQALDESLVANFDTTDGNATIIVTVIDIGKDGVPVIYETLTQGKAVPSRVCNQASCPAGTTLDLKVLGTQNQDFNNDSSLCTGGTECFNDLVVVEAYYDHEQVLKLPLISSLFPDPIHVVGMTVMRVTQPRAP